MTMPVTLTLIRHGESESNKAKSAFEQGTPLAVEDALMSVHTSERRLTPLGIEQASLAGAWLRENWPGFSEPSRLYVSPYVRAMETAAHLGLNAGEWRVDSRIMERNWGDFDQMPYGERLKLFEKELRYRKDHAFYWRPTNGETFQDVFHRLRDKIATLHRECSDLHVLAVTHGETMWVWRTILECWTPFQLREAMLAQDEQVRIRNCRIIQYTRQLADGTISPKISRVRFINPEAPNDQETNLGWVPVERKRWTDQELLQYAAEFPTFIPAEAA